MHTPDLPPVRKPFRRRVLATLAVLLTLLTGGAAFWLHAQQSDSRPLASLLPPGALLYLEAKDLQALVTQWNASEAKRQWLAGDNFSVLSRSRLVGRLAEARDQFTTVAGVPVAYNLVNELSGTHSAFVFYDLAALHFVYLTHLENESRLEQSPLWKSRSAWQSRSAAGIAFFVNVDPATARTVALASWHGWLVLTTTEQSMAQTLALLSGASAGNLAAEPWFRAIASTQTSGAAADLRLVYNLESLLPTAQFRTYWLQQNQTALKMFAAGVADLNESADGFTETRTLLKRAPATATTGADLTGVLRYAASSASLSRAWSAPSPATLNAVLNQVVLGEQPAGASASLTAPAAVDLSSGTVSPVSSSELETRIDTPPPAPLARASVAELAAEIFRMEPIAMLHLQATVETADGVFTLPASAAVIECRHPALPASPRIDLLRAGALDPLTITREDNKVILSRLQIAAGPQPTFTIAPSTTYAAFFDKSREWPHYKQLFSILDRPASTETPAFFSGNLASLGDALSGLQRVSLNAHDEPAQLTETVHYEFIKR